MGQQLQISTLLNYLFNDFAVTFIACLFGSILKDGLDTMNKGNKINIKKIIISSLFGTVLLCGIDSYFKVSFNIYILICVLVGMWGFCILKACSNSGIMLVLLKHILGNIKDPVTKALKDTVDEIEDKNSQEPK